MYREKKVYIIDCEYQFAMQSLLLQIKTNRTIRNIARLRYHVPNSLELPVNRSSILYNVHMLH